MLDYWVRLYRLYRLPIQQVLVLLRPPVEGTVIESAFVHVQLLAGLRFNKSLIRQIFREGIMRESVIYQEILQEGEQKGERLGEERGILKGKLEGEQTVILRQLARRIGEISPELQSQIQSLSLYQLEALADALLDFSSLADLRTWLQTNQG